MKKNTKSVFKHVKEFLFLSLFFSIASFSYAANPSTPFSPNDNVLDPGCLPTDSNCYVSLRSLTSLAIDATAALTGSELITNGSFTGSATGWTLGSNASYSGGKVTSTYSGGDPTISQSFTTQAGHTYAVTFTVSNSNAPVYMYAWSGYSENRSFRDGTHTSYIKAIGSSDTVYFDDWKYVNGDTWSIDNVSVKEVLSTSTLAVTGASGENALVLGGDVMGNVGLGNSALSSLTVGTANTGIGTDALTANTSGYWNSALGTHALFSNISGAFNSAFGSYSLLSNTTGNSNDAFGMNSLNRNITGNHNSAFGISSLLNNINGIQNAAFGSDSLYYSKGDRNTAIGGSVGWNPSNDISRFQIASDTDMVLLGYGATKDSTSTLTNGIAIGAGAHVLQSNQAVLGNDSITSTLLKGNVGVGTNDPQFPLHVYKNETSSGGNYGGANVTLDANPTVNGTTGYDGLVTYSAFNADKDLTGWGYVRGGTFTASNGGSGTVANVFGAGVQASNFGVGTVNNLTGLNVYLYNDQASGTVTSSYGINIQPADNYGGGGWQNNYGLYIGDQSGVGSTNSFNLYSAGANSKNYFAGNVGIGTTSPTAAKFVIENNDDTNGARITTTIPAGGGYDHGLDIILKGAPGFNDPGQVAGIYNTYNSVGTNDAIDTQDYISSGYYGDTTCSIGHACAGIWSLATASGVNGFVIGLAGDVTGSLSSNNRIIGVFGNASPTSTKYTGGYFSLGAPGYVAAPENAALIADNASSTSPIFLARDNGSTVFSIVDGGNVGIGTTTPNAMLSIDNTNNSIPSLAVTGTAWFRPFTSNPFSVVPGTNDQAALMSYSVINGGNWSGAGITESASAQLQVNSIGTPSAKSAAFSVYLENTSGKNLNRESGILVDGAGFGTSTAIGSGIDIEQPWQLPIDYAALRIQDQGASQYAIKVEGGKSTFAGQVGIGTTTPQYTLHVGNTTIPGVVARFENSTGYCDINPTTTSLTCTSDERLKKNIVTLDASTTLNNLRNLRAVTYNWKTEGDASSTHAGFIAQEVKPLFPDLVAQDPTGTYSVSYGGFIPYIIQSIQEILTRMDGWGKKFSTKELCVDKSTGGEVCVTGDQLDSLLNLNQQVITVPVQIPVASDSSSTESSATTTETVDASTTTDTSTTTDNTQTSTDTPITETVVDPSSTTTTP